MHHDYFLRFADEAQARTTLYETIDSVRPVLVTNHDLEIVLDGLPLDDAEWSQTVTHAGKQYMADAGKWYELIPMPETGKPKYHAIDTIGVIYKPTGATTMQDGESVPMMAPIEGWHVNVRHTSPAPELDAFAVVPTVPVRVFG